MGNTVIDPVVQVTACLGEPPTSATVDRAGLGEVGRAVLHLHAQHQAELETARVAREYPMVGTQIMLRVGDYPPPECFELGLDVALSRCTSCLGPARPHRVPPVAVCAASKPHHLPASPAAARTPARRGRHPAHDLWTPSDVPVAR